VQRGQVVGASAYGHDDVDIGHVSSLDSIS
jgi:hypothetical protein